MKVQIDLNEILGGEDWQETLPDSIRRQVVEHLTKTITAGVHKQLNEQISSVLNDQLRTAVVERMPGLVTDIMETEYTPVGRYGERAQPTTFRAELVKQIHEQMVYKRAQYDSDKNAFTKAVDSTVAEYMKAFQQLFLKEVDTRFVAEAMAYATSKLAERLGVKK